MERKIIYSDKFHDASCYDFKKIMSIKPLEIPRGYLGIELSDKTLLKIKWHKLYDYVSFAKENFILFKKNEQKNRKMHIIEGCT